MTLPDVLFHCAPIPLQPGSVIEPGNWGRLVERYEATNGQVPINGLNEVALEFARQAYAPEKPSRFNCLFALESEDGARSYRDAHQTTNLIYKIVPVSDPGPFHIGNYTLPVFPHVGRYVPQMLTRFRDYWLEPATEFREVLISCPIRLLERVG